VVCLVNEKKSVGSLGRNGDDARVENVHVRNCTFLGSSNGVRLETWRVRMKLRLNENELMNE